MNFRRKIIIPQKIEIFSIMEILPAMIKPKVYPSNNSIS